MRRTTEQAQKTLESVLKACFWESLAEVSLNERQRKVLNLLLDGMEGRRRFPKWAKLTKSSQDTAARDIARLIELNISTQPRRWPQHKLLPEARRELSFAF